MTINYAADLIAFLRARYDEAQRDAENRRGVWPHPSVEDNGAVWLHCGRGGNAVITRYPHPVEGYGDMATLRSWATPEGQGYNREFVLADVESKRQIIEIYELVAGSPEVSADVRTVMKRVLRDLALPYVDHPDYRREEL